MKLHTALNQLVHPFTIQRDAIVRDAKNGNVQITFTSLYQSRTERQSLDSLIQRLRPLKASGHISLSIRASTEREWVPRTPSTRECNAPWGGLVDLGGGMGSDDNGGYYTNSEARKITLRLSADVAAKLENLPNGTKVSAENLATLLRETTPRAEASTAIASDDDMDAAPDSLEDDLADELSEYFENAFSEVPEMELLGQKVMLRNILLDPDNRDSLLNNQADSITFNGKPLNRAVKQHVGAIAGLVSEAVENAKSNPNFQQSAEALDTALTDFAALLVADIPGFKGDATAREAHRGQVAINR